jgi:hypothetical protein
MKLAVACCALAACHVGYTVDGTSARALKAGDDHLDLAMSPHDAAQAVIEKLGARGFTVVDAQPTPRGYTLKLAGNRDFSGILTIGSVFYAWLDGDADVTHVRLVGKPTVDHVESCPSLDPDHNQPCKWLETFSSVGVTGYEEAVVIHGVFSELRLDGAAAATQTAELGHLTLHGCGRP